MRPVPFSTLLALAAALAAACSSSSSPPASPGDGGNELSDAGPSGDAGGGASDAVGDTTPVPVPCTSDTDCSGGGICGFPTAGGCSATGTCFPAPGATCQAYGPGCACDGTTVNVVCNGLPLGYAPKPLLHSGDCASDGAAG